MILEFHKVRKQYQFNVEEAKHNQKGSLKNDNGYIRPSAQDLLVKIGRKYFYFIG